MDLTTKALLKSFFTNLFLSILKVVIGTIGKSTALMADGIHSFSDLVTDFVALFGNKYALKPADKEHPFGHGRFEYLTCLMIGIVVSMLGIEIITSAIEEEIIIPNKIVIIVSLFTIITKFMLSTYLIRKGKKHNNAILIASGKESSADVISSVVVLISSILMQYSNKYEVLSYSNLIATIVVGAFIIKTGIMILKENISFILGQEEGGETKEKMLSILKKEKKIIQIDNFIVLKNGPYFQITSEVSMDEKMTLKEVHAILEKIEEKLKKQDERAKYINIHVNPIKKTI